MNGKLTVGLTGGIASGKSKAAEMFCRAGAYSIDTDVISRQVSESGEGHDKLLRAFPQAFADGVLQRRVLRQIVFADEAKRQQLNAILHPLIYERTQKQIQSAVSGIVLVIAPLLFETGFDALTQCNIAVVCDASVRIERLVARDTISVELARQMTAAQWSDAERAKKADIVIDNNGSEAQLRAQVGRIYCELCDRLGR